MKVSNTSYFCDKCNNQMLENEYNNLAVKITIRLDLPNPKGGCGEASIVSATLCKECSKELGIENIAEYHDFIYSNRNLKNVVEKCKGKIIELFKSKL